MYDWIPMREAFKLTMEKLNAPRDEVNELLLHALKFGEITASGDKFWIGPEMGYRNIHLSTATFMPWLVQQYIRRHSN